MLGRAGFLDEAHAAMHLDAGRGDVDADIGGEGLGDRGEDRGAFRQCACLIGLAMERSSASATR
jgi:hypothetical protein